MTVEEVESHSTSYHHKTILPSFATPWPSYVVDVSYELAVVVVVIVAAVIFVAAIVQIGLRPTGIVAVLVVNGHVTLNILLNTYVVIIIFLNGCTTMGRKYGYL